jgi:hypothetical protein
MVLSGLLGVCEISKNATLEKKHSNYDLVNNIISPLSASIACTYNGLENIRSSFLPVRVSTRVVRTAAAQYLAVILVAAGWDRFNCRR